jgi:hypothetical protein
MKTFIVKTHDNMTQEEIQDLLQNTEVEEI